MTPKYKFLLIMALVMATIALFFVFNPTSSKSPTSYGDIGNGINLSSATSTTITCGTTTSTVLLANSRGGRQYALFTLDAATTTDICLNAVCTTSTASTNFGSRGQSYTISFIDLYPGTVSCITLAGTSTIDVLSQQ